MKKRTYEPGQTLNGYAVFKTTSRKPTTPVYYAPAATTQAANVDIEVAMRHIAECLNLLKNNDISAEMKVATEERLKQYEKYKQ